MTTTPDAHDPNRIYCAACEEFERTGHTNEKHARECPHAAPWVDKTRYVMGVAKQPVLDRTGIVAELTGAKPSEQPAGTAATIAAEINAVTGHRPIAEPVIDGDHAMPERVLKAIAEVHAVPDGVDASRMGAMRTVGNFVAQPIAQPIDQPTEPMRLQFPHMQVVPSVPPEKTREGDQPLPEANTYPPIQTLVIKDMEARKTIGLRRYGTLLQPFNGRDALRDLYEELLDATMYIRQVIYERDGTSGNGK
jgi:hypothetical protein